MSIEMFSDKLHLDYITGKVDMKKNCKDAEQEELKGGM